MTRSSVNFVQRISGIMIALLFLSVQIHAQNYWLGGAIGQETNWNHPANWSENHVPDWADLAVVIPNVESQSGYFPEISNEVPEIPYLLIEGGAYVTILESGHLVIDGGTTYNYGIHNVGSIFNGGQLTILKTAMDHFAEPRDNVYNYGVIALGTTAGNFEQELAINH